MTRPIVLGFFVLLCAAQLWAAGSGIARYERTLSDGTPYRFQCAAIDPEDPFRGRYVRLGFAAEQTEAVIPESGLGRRRLFAVLGEKLDGTAYVTAFSDEAPEGGDFLSVDAHPLWQDDTSTTTMSFAFDRFFMEESAAPEAERAYFAALRSGGSATNTYAVVRVLDGLGVIEKLVIDGVDVGASR